MTLPLAVAVGDSAGIGPEISVRAAAALAGRVPCVLFGDVRQLAELAARFGVEASAWSGQGTLPSRIALCDTGAVPERLRHLHAPSAESGAQQLTTLQTAARFVQAGMARALVTGPTSKAAVVLAGHKFTGQTECLAQLEGLADDAVSMLFLGPKLRVGLVTTHLALTDVSPAVTAPRVARTVRHTAAAIARLYPERTRRLAVIGLNPHAGEHGLFGREEIDVLEPLLAELRAELAGVELTGPAPAESVFRAAQRAELEGVVAMYHDQATIAAKLLDWGASVNTTWGLSFVRTSVDHGVAYDAARAGNAEEQGMIAAMDMALRLTNTRPS